MSGHECIYLLMSLQKGIEYAFLLKNILFLILLKLLLLILICVFASGLARMFH